MNNLVCRDCTEDFTHKRNDVARCSDCSELRKQQYAKEYRTSEHAKALRAAAYRKVREAAFAGYGGACACCDEDTFEFLALDHVNGGGRKERETLCTYQIARKIINEGWPDTYQVLCHNCNQAKGWYGECPHRRRSA